MSIILKLIAVLPTYLLYLSGAIAAPAIPESIICSTPQLFTAKIKSVKSLDCRLKHEQQCSPRDVMVVQMQVSRILKANTLDARNDKRFVPMPQTDLSIYLFSFISGANRFPPLLSEAKVPAPMTDQWLSDFLVGQSFVFLVGSQPFGFPSSFSTEPPMLSGSALPIDPLPWVEETLQTCKSYSYTPYIY